MAALGAQGSGAEDPSHLQRDRKLSTPRCAHPQVPGRGLAWHGRPLHPDHGQVHPYRLRSQTGQVTYPCPVDPVNHALARADTEKFACRSQTTFLLKLSASCSVPSSVGRESRLMMPSGNFLPSPNMSSPSSASMSSKMIRPTTGF